MNVARSFAQTARYCALAVLLSLLPVSPLSADDTPPIPPEVSLHAAEWPLANQNYANTRSAVSTIDAANVRTLGLDWSFDIPSASLYGSAATNPLIVDGVVYFEDLAGNVYALDLGDGHVIWQQNYGVLNEGPNGVAVGWGKVFATVAPNLLVALDLSTGRELWRSALSVKPDDEGIDIQPVAYGGLVLVSTVPNSGVDSYYHGGAHGMSMALDQQTGAVVWRFDTIDNANIWGNPGTNSGGGSWYPPAVDIETGLTYWGTGNPAPFPGDGEYPNGSSRPGSNLYTDSLLALGLEDGHLEWYRQVRPHDLFDLDFQLSPILTQIALQGTSRDVVIGGGKPGKVFAFDRATGEELWQTSVGRHENDELTEIPPGKRLTVYPGMDGGIETPMALSDDGILYAPTLNLPTDFAATHVFYNELDLTKGTSEFVALDVNSGAILWKRAFDGLLFGGATVVNDLVFTAEYEGTIYALDRKTGDLVWHYQATNGINGWPAVVGDTLIWPTGVGSHPKLLALKLGKAGSAP